MTSHFYGLTFLVTSLATTVLFGLILAGYHINAIFPLLSLAACIWAGWKIGS